MKKIVALTFTHLMLQIATAQNYQVIRSDRTVFYGAEQHSTNDFYDLDCIRIDSLKVVEQDSIFYPFNTIYQISDNCYDPFGPSLFGKQIVIQPNGFNLLFNKNNDTIKIKTDAELGESWVVSGIRGSIAIKATVVEHRLKSFLELEDSVKTIEFQPVNEIDTNKLPIFGSFIEVSKNYGLVNGLNFGEFPDTLNRYYNKFYHRNTLKEHQLLGLNNPQVGLQNLTWFDVFDFDIGDELHIDYQAWSCPDYYSSKTIETYTNRVENRNENNEITSITYTKKITQSDTSFIDIDIVIPKFNFDTLPHLPYESKYSSYWHTKNKMHLHGDFLIKNLPLSNDHYCIKEDYDCWENGCITNGDLVFSDYYKGLGGPYFDFDLGQCNNGERKLVYYKKGDRTWGTPLDPTNIEESNFAQPQIQISPNPVNQQFTVTLNQKYLPADLFILSIDGKAVKHLNINNSSLQVKVHDFSPGIYLLKIETEKHSFASQKLVVDK